MLWLQPGTLPSPPLQTHVASAAPLSPCRCLRHLTLHTSRNYFLIPPPSLPYHPPHLSASSPIVKSPWTLLSISHPRPLSGNTVDPTWPCPPLSPSWTIAAASSLPPCSLLPPPTQTHDRAPHEARGTLCTPATGHVPPCSEPCGVSISVRAGGRDLITARRAPHNPALSFL